MALIDEVRAACARLAGKGWKELLAAHGLNVAAADLEAELLKPLPNIKRDLAGFEDFALEGKRGIEPGHPARSLLYHAFASPGVVFRPGGGLLEEFPTLAEIEVVENYCFAARKAKLEDIRALAGAELAVVVFATEYRLSIETCHRKHADLVFSRTGVARVGTAEALYHPRLRGFVPLVDGQPTQIRVLPSRFSTYLAFQRKGSASDFCPMPSFLAEDKNPNEQDANRTFWQPIHKVFDGAECLSGLQLHADMRAHHQNEKLARIHKQLNALNLPSRQGAELSQPPFVFTAGIAELDARNGFSKGVIVPSPHPLVEPAIKDGSPLTFHVPPKGSAGTRLFGSSFGIKPKGDARKAPEFIHARTLVDANGSQTDLNTKQDVRKRVEKGGYKALHYVDFTGDGYVDASCEELRNKVIGFFAAYSLVTSPDFFTRCDQRELTEWTATLAQRGVVEVWGTPPDPLSDDRFAPNLQLSRPDGSHPFTPKDDTSTAIVSMFGEVGVQTSGKNFMDIARHSHMPDDAAGFFAPGWDVSHDELGGVLHLAAYGLGSPFPEDAKLCAALSTFWPAVAPDSSRTFGNAQGATVSPLTDAELGVANNLPWDGIAPPKALKIGGQDVAEFAEFDHGDYVRSALDGNLNLFLTSVVTVDDYRERVVRMLNVYAALGIDVKGTDKFNEKRAWIVHSFRKLTSEDSELHEARLAAHGVPMGTVYRVDVYQDGGPVSGGGPSRQRVAMAERTTLLVDERQVWTKPVGGSWARTNAVV
ncbi:MAG: hypothetical protein QOJ65_2338 [Fimbriimonadaceae bacterium]|jgi:hypothetical protein|nr:hypothetical protein [Fimbriimonadaceae bacterium]